MKAYFTTSLSNIEKIREYVDSIFSSLEEIGHSVDKFNYMKDPNIESKSDNDMADAYRHIIKSIKSADFVIAELSGASTGAGFEIAYALGEKKPVLILYNENIRKQLPTPFRGNKSKLLKIKKYKTADDIKSALRYFTNDVHDIVDTKFILIIPPEIDRYLEWNTRERGKAKAEVTREAMERAISEDKKYQEYLKDHEVTE